MANKSTGPQHNLRITISTVQEGRADGDEISQDLRPMAQGGLEEFCQLYLGKLYGARKYGDACHLMIRRAQDDDSIDSGECNRIIRLLETEAINGEPDEYEIAKQAIQHIFELIDATPGTKG